MPTTVKKTNRKKSANGISQKVAAAQLEPLKVVTEALRPLDDESRARVISCVSILYGLGRTVSDLIRAAEGRGFE